MNTQSKYRTVLIGFGDVAAGYTKDPVKARNYRYASHAQVLREHNAFDWQAVVDSNGEARKRAKQDWEVSVTYSDTRELAQAGPFDIAVIATPPKDRYEMIESMEGLRAVLVEKPLGHTKEEADRFLQLCRERNILVQVNYWRRADERFRELAAGKLVETIGQPQAVFGVYAKGLRNNGSHMIDFVRMLFGEIDSQWALGPADVTHTGLLEGDADIPFALQLQSGLLAAFQPLDFNCFRENGLDIWGQEGRMQIVQEGLKLLVHCKQPSRTMQGANEVSSDEVKTIDSTVGDAFYRIYDNLICALTEGTSLFSPGESALVNEAVVQALNESAKQAC